MGTGVVDVFHMRLQIRNLAAQPRGPRVVFGKRLHEPLHIVYKTLAGQISWITTEDHLLQLSLHPRIQA
ncbi:hypothetical protein LAUMK4_00052 [Mycobacterium persicum]|uniref:Uncharacterized protein n=1 Tax=Mycobacterium persicum TaxID=1487726 RepID=A0AB38ULK9_9MYCO|nr:hypothetical protein LAUMK15_00402 [Mycobacterium persicum]VAZ81465.1 hypothetical protein LAUMK42_00266 [Mycobacterium persicum]VAZ86811.1 hypothetical protein LAUMK4_00052 [Mycobacterium persicum]